MSDYPMTGDQDEEEFRRDPRVKLAAAAMGSQPLASNSWDDPAFRVVLTLLAITTASVVSGGALILGAVGAWMAVGRPVPLVLMWAVLAVATMVTGMLCWILQPWVARRADTIVNTIRMRQAEPANHDPLQHSDGAGKP